MTVVLFEVFMQILLYLLSFGVSLIGMPYLLRLSFTIGAIDRPDGQRRRHARPTPRLGGLGIFSVFFVTVCVAVPLSDPRAAALLCGGGLLVAAGVVDDVRTLSPTSKLALQTAASAVALLFLDTPRTLRVLGWELALPAGAAFVLSLLLCVTIINGVNLIDGVDGLCGGVMTVVLLTVGAWCAARGDGEGVTLALLLCMPLLAFLLYNRPPATVFLGDAGAQLLGLAAAILLLPTRGAALSVPSFVLLGVPLGELAASAVRRLLRRQNPLHADDGHLHFRLLRYGMSPSGVSLSYILLTALCAVLAHGLTFAA